MRQMRQQKTGAALLLAMLLVIFISIITVGIMRHAGLQGIKMIEYEQSTQAFWNAEAGLQQAIHILDRNHTYRESISVNDTIAGTTTNCTVSVVAIDTSVAGVVSCTLHAVGTDHRKQTSRVIEQAVRFKRGFDCALYCEKLNTTANFAINGKAYQPIGAVSIGGTLDITEGLYLKSNASYSMGDIAVISGIAIPDIPTLNTNQYKNYINSLPALADAYYTPISSGTTNTTLEIHTHTTEKNLVTTSGGTLLINSPITDNATLIVDGTIRIINGATFGTNVLIYSTGNLAINASDSVTDLTLLSENNVTLEGSFNFNGIIYAVGTVNLDTTGTTSGSIIAETLKVTRDGTLQYDPTVFPTREGAFNDLKDVAPLCYFWQERPL